MENETKQHEDLSPEVGGAMTVPDPYGVGELKVEGVRYPLVDTGMPGVHSNGNEPLEY